jgi:hypothetical protein
MEATSALAVIGPMPGIFASFWLAAFSRCHNLDLNLQFLDLAVEFLEVVAQALDQLAERCPAVRSLRPPGSPAPRGDVAIPWGMDDAEFGQQAADLVGLRRARLDETLPRAVQRQHRLLFDAFLIGTKRIVGRVTASQMASASAASFLFVLT